jgi:long-subunit fatty acid transport protein
MTVAHAMHRRWGPRAVILLGLCLPGASAAQFQFPPTLLVPNYNRVFPGLDESIEAGASLVRSGTPPALWYNPAGLVLSDRTTVNASVQGYEVTLLRSSDILNGGTQESNISTVPTFFGIVLGTEAIHIQNLRFGFGMSNNVSWEQGVNNGAALSSSLNALYAVNSELTQYQAEGAVSYAVNEKFRLGFELAIPYTYLNNTGQIAGVKTTPTSLTTTSRTLAISAYNFHILPVVSFQWEALPWLGVGGVFQPPALEVLRGGSVTLTGVDTENATTPGLTRQLAFRDTKATFNYRIPAELSTGLAFHFGIVEFELDAHWYIATGTYNLISSSAQVHRVNAVSGVPPQTVVSPFPTQIWGTRNLVDLNLGGSVRVSKLIKLLAGFYSDHAPGNVQSNIFQNITFYGVRAGISFNSSSLSGSVGLGYEWGSTTVPLTTSFPGSPVATFNQPLNLATISLLFALAYVF